MVMIDKSLTCLDITFFLWIHDFALKIQVAEALSQRFSRVRSGVLPA